jgi:hypothetical protein
MKADLRISVKDYLEISDRRLVSYGNGAREMKFKFPAAGNLAEGLENSPAL